MDRYSKQWPAPQAAAVTAGRPVSSPRGVEGGTEGRGPVGGLGRGRCGAQVAAARHGALFQRFIAALTRGGPGGTPRPIEMHAHDPRRYVGCAPAALPCPARTGRGTAPPIAQLSAAQQATPPQCQNPGRCRALRM